MKQRLGFVSNSSSSSFVVAKTYLSQNQIDNLIEVCKTPVGTWKDSWDIIIDEYNVRGVTFMDNGCGEGGGGLYDWMKAANFPMDAVVWYDY